MSQIKKDLPTISRDSDFWVETICCFECSVCHEINEQGNDDKFNPDILLVVECGHCGARMRVV